MGGAWGIILEALCLRDALPYSCLLLRAVICCWSIPAANYSIPCASSTCIWEWEEAGEWGTEGSGLCLTIRLVKHWYYLGSFPPSLQCMMQGKPPRLRSFIVLTVLSIKHNSICPFLLTLAIHNHTRISKTTMARPCSTETFFSLERLCTAQFQALWKPAREEMLTGFYCICVASWMPNNTALRAWHSFITWLCKRQDAAITGCTKWAWQVTSKPLYRLHFYPPCMVAVYPDLHLQLLAWYFNWFILLFGYHMGLKSLLQT